MMSGNPSATELAVTGSGSGADHSPLLKAAVAAGEPDNITLAPARIAARGHPSARAPCSVLRLDTMTASYGAWSGTPPLPSPMRSSTSRMPCRARLDRAGRSPAASRWWSGAGARLRCPPLERPARDLRSDGAASVISAVFRAMAGGWVCRRAHGWCGSRRTGSTGPGSPVAAFAAVGTAKRVADTPTTCAARCWIKPPGKLTREGRPGRVTGRAPAAQGDTRCAHHAIVDHAHASDSAARLLLTSVIPPAHGFARWHVGQVGF